eukprot:CAMPEP_0184505032 /NCGR_PEP_ID=MMETSP0113_2-20130426/52774_1 /TAXON_ID=91329 /ORGANISM="Norrisiella sphaerica, Strain BC52" /LENGTH=100 /DNA_ID=CAMNT_0026894699 /DNA_START=1149 /DNA_END=1451 /DNA_ORIENTATION=-
MFHHKVIHETSWQHPRSIQWHLLDHAITDRDKKSAQSHALGPGEEQCARQTTIEFAAALRLSYLKNKRHKVWRTKKDSVPTRLDARELVDEETKKNLVQN